MAVNLTDRDRELLGGAQGDGAALAMRIVVALAEAQDARRLIDVTGAHVDGCLYHGRAGLDFARRLLDGGARIHVPTTLNVTSLDLLHPSRVVLDPETSRAARALVDAYVALGCAPTWTCAPYQLRSRPRIGQHVAWGESNAIVFANSVLGARTERYGDFADVACAITGRAPFVGLHTEEGRRATSLLRVAGDVPGELLGTEAGLAAVGLVLGRWAGAEVTGIEGLPAATTEDGLKALGAAAASSGAVGMFHAVGITPEAPTLEAATGGRPPERVRYVGASDLRAARDELSSVLPGDRLGAVSLGTPHLSLEGFGRLARAIPPGSRFAVPVYVNTGRDVLEEAQRLGYSEPLARAGATIVTDTCTYVTPVIGVDETPVMTDSGKWAWYAPTNLDAEVAFGSTEECLRSALSGSLVRDAALWGDD